VRRLQRAETSPPEAPVSKELLAIAADARVFGQLSEGQRVRYQQKDGLGEGYLVEKCRFGGMIERADGTVVGVGFRRIWAADALGLS
jgi:hypothetical protein